MSSGSGKLNTNDYYKRVLSRVNRLAVMRDLALLNSPEEPFFDQLTQLASKTIGTPVSLVSLVADNYQFFKSSSGLPEPWKSRRRTPLSHSFCQHVVVTGNPLIVTDAREEDFLKDNLAIPDLDVIGYLGMPIQTPDGDRLGSFCVIDSKPHTWTEDEIAIVQAFSRVVNAEIEARGIAYSERQLQRYIAIHSSTRLEKLRRNLESATTVNEIIAHLNELANEILHD